MPRTAKPRVGVVVIACLFMMLWACSDEENGLDAFLGGICNDDGRCDGTYVGRISGAADTSRCDQNRVIFTVTGDRIEFSEFEADCSRAPCWVCYQSFNGKSTLDSASCIFTYNHVGQTIMEVSGELDRGSCEFVGAYRFGGPVSCPCWDQGSWNASQ